MQILILSPYHGGSHKAWAEGFQRHSRHQVDLLTLPARFWKWRMHGGAITLARRFREYGRRQPDLLLATDMLDLTTFLALTRQGQEGPATALYMHENQLTYPLPGDGHQGPMRRQRGERDLHYAFINYASMLAADAVFFNSAYHRRTLFEALPRFLKHFPEYNELQTLDSLRERSKILPLGLDLEGLRRAKDNREKHKDLEGVDGRNAPLIIWNQRWEYDKNPAAFFAALYTLAGEGLPFRLALCGQSFRQRPQEFEEARRRLHSHIVHWGYAGRRQYAHLLWEADITLSTAHHEFFGVSILEAIFCRVFPILPHRLSYPELVPQAYHAQCLYENNDGLLRRLRWALTHRQEAAAVAAGLAPTVSAFAWKHMAPRYDRAFAEISTISDER